jgi:carboxylesterase type B
MIKFASVLAIISIIAPLAICNDAPIVSTDCGQLKGKVATTSKGKCSMFLGVPFASPPIENLRFSKPQPPKPWDGVRDATEFGPICIQVGSNATDSKKESEDCLHLNIFVPKATPQTHIDKKYPVMIFIHGGGFISGSAKSFGDVNICENLASRQVIVVTIQYRLNLYGFVSTGDKAALGNYGIWDQVESLKWVQRNIAQFGGDPKRVTIFGESAGGASVSLLTYTPVAKDLFHQSIAGSGSALSTWGTPNDASVVTTKNLAKAAKCTNSDQNSVIECLRQLSAPKLQNVYNALLNLASRDFTLAMPWSVRVDGELFKEKQLQELKTGKPTMIGVNSNEMTASADWIPNVDSKINSWLEELFPGNETKSTVLRQAARYVYVDSKGDRNDPMILTQQYAELVSDTMFRAWSAKEAEWKVLAGSPVWTYKFDYYSNNVFPPGFKFKKGANHAHELCYLFLKPKSPKPESCPNSLCCPSKYEGMDRKVADDMAEMWTNFAIKGNPSPSSIKWPQFYNVSNANTMHIRGTLEILPDFYMDISNFWNYLVPNIEEDFKS